MYYRVAIQGEAQPAWKRCPSSLRERTRDSSPPQSRRYSYCKRGGSLHKERRGKHSHGGHEQTSERPPSLPNPRHLPTRAAWAHWTSEGKHSNAERVAFMTCHTGSCCPTRCHKSSAG